MPRNPKNSQNQDSNLPSERNATVAGTTTSRTARTGASASRTVDLRAYREPMDGNDSEEGSAGEASSDNTSSSEEQTERRRRTPRKSLVTKVSEILPHIRRARISPFDLFRTLVDDDNEEYRPYRTELYKENNKMLPTILDNIAASPLGRDKLVAWLRSPTGASMYEDIIVEEMDMLRDKHKMKGLAEITPQFIQQQQARRPLPTGQLTEFFPLRVSTHEEASTGGNILYHNEVYLEMLKQTQEDLSTRCILSVNDQLTNARIRSGQHLRADDVNNYQRRLIFQLGIGLFHAALNLSWVLLHTHRGTLSEIGSLSYWFAILDKTRLGGQKPDYHMLYATLVEILEGVILAAWRKVCGDDGTTLDQYASSKPSPEDLQDKAGMILDEYLTPLPPIYSVNNDDDDTEETSGNLQPVPAPVKCDGQLDPSKDKVNQNLHLLMRDTLYLLELVSATKDGDVCRIEDIFPHLAMIYRGAGSNKYCIEVLFMIQNLKYIWTPELADVMWDTLIVNPSGIPGHFIATDANMEYTIRLLKELIIVKGLQTTWDRTGYISSTISLVNEIKRKIAKEFPIRTRLTLTLMSVN